MQFSERVWKFLICAFILCLQQPLLAQDDTSDTVSDTFFLLRYKGLLGKLGQAMVADTSRNGPEKDIERNDKRFQRYRGRIIRNIELVKVDFGTPITDTSKKFTNSLIRIANNFHRQTRSYVIRNNLFFSENQKVLPFLIADNERHLRDLVYLGDARIRIRPVRGSRDSVDIVVLTKDVLSIGGGFRLSSVNRMEANIRDDNIFGWGDRFMVRGLYDSDRREKFGVGAEYIRRNIGGSFIDGTMGFQSFAPTLNTGRKEETLFYVSMIKPLVNPYMRWTYAVEAARRSTKNMYLDDSLYNSDFRYSNYNLDAWASYNMKIHPNTEKIKDERLRTIIGLRYMQEKFQRVPGKYEDQFFFQYTDMTAVLGSLSIFRQDFYKTRFIYGFGRSEDVPEGVDVTITTGWTKKQERVRGYSGLGIEFNYFTRKQDYYSYTLRIGGYTKSGKYEDVDLLANIDYFSPLKDLGRWKRRTFLTVGFTSQFRQVLNEPLFLASNFGLPEHRNDSLFGGNLRATVRAESVFYSPFSLLSFKFAPFVFGNASWIDGNTPATVRRHLFSSIGGGLRIRNESLIFGTIQLKGFYFPGKNLYNEHFRVEFATNLQFKYNRQVIKRPELILVN